MAQNTTPITLVGNLVDDPELRFTPSGAAVANFRVASTPRSFNKDTNQWEDDEALFLSVSIWRQAAENVANTLAKGMRVIVEGDLVQRSYEKDGQNRQSYEIQAREVGPSLTFASAQVNRNPRDGGQQGGQGGNFGQQGGGFGNQQQAGFNGQQGQGGFSGQQNQGGFSGQQQGGFNQQAQQYQQQAGFNGQQAQGGFSGQQAQGGFSGQQTG